ncbi:hypothetical protein DYB32_003923 [Aphanomyces invadans]|uniref:Uncharacterized protein n=1 Tax=Aphanomyces invadans TaxID=157072 RepID=A0A3R6Z0B5_9STRA|nr:hypothetical protein DYB32_003923 [Aphanomyces invadans]
MHAFRALEDVVTTGRKNMVDEHTRHQVVRAKYMTALQNKLQSLQQEYIAQLDIVAAQITSAMERQMLQLYKCHTTLQLVSPDEELPAKGSRTSASPPVFLAGPATSVHAFFTDNALPPTSWLASDPKVAATGQSGHCHVLVCQLDPAVQVHIRTRPHGHVDSFVFLPPAAPASSCPSTVGVIPQYYAVCAATPSSVDEAELRQLLQDAANPPSVIRGDDKATADALLHELHAKMKREVESYQRLLWNDLQPDQKRFPEDAQTLQQAVSKLQSHIQDEQDTQRETNEQVPPTPHILPGATKVPRAPLTKSDVEFAEYKDDVAGPGNTGGYIAFEEIEQFRPYQEAEKCPLHNQIRIDRMVQELPRVLAEKSFELGVCYMIDIVKEFNPRPFTPVQWRALKSNRIANKRLLEYTRVGLKHPQETIVEYVGVYCHMFFSHRQRMPQSYLNMRVALENFAEHRSTQPRMDGPTVGHLAWAYRTHQAYVRPQVRLILPCLDAMQLIKPLAGLASDRSSRRQDDDASLKQTRRRPESAHADIKAAA